jgi:hypothetical protein
MSGRSPMVSNGTLNQLTQAVRVPAALPPTMWTQHDLVGGGIASPASRKLSAIPVGYLAAPSLRAVVDAVPCEPWPRLIARGRGHLSCDTWQAQCPGIAPCCGLCDRDLRAVHRLGVSIPPARFRRPVVVRSAHIACCSRPSLPVGSTRRRGSARAFPSAVLPAWAAASS